MLLWKGNTGREKDILIRKNCNLGAIDVKNIKLYRWIVMHQLFHSNAKRADGKISSQAWGCYKTLYVK